MIPEAARWKVTGNTSWSEGEGDIKWSASLKTDHVKNILEVGGMSKKQDTKKSLVMSALDKSIISGLLKYEIKTSEVSELQKQMNLMSIGDSHNVAFIQTAVLSFLEK